MQVELTYKIDANGVILSAAVAEMIDTATLMLVRMHEQAPAQTDQRRVFVHELTDTLATDATNYIRARVFGTSLEVRCFVLFSLSHYDVCVP